MFVVQMIDKLYCFSAVVAEMNAKYSGFPQKLLPHTPGAHAWTSRTRQLVITLEAPTSWTRR